MLKLSGIKKRFGATIALNGVDFEVRPGEVHALIGENGAGKSTLMNLLSGSLQPDAGVMQLGGTDYRPASPLDARRHGIAHIHQELSLCAHVSVAENILMGMEPSRWGWVNHDALHRRTAEILKRFHHPEIVPEKRVSELSLAACQVVEICRALAQDANIILMDEPTSSLQREDVDRLFDFIRSLKGSDVSIIYISHFLEEVREIADSFTVLRDGQSVSSGSIAGVSNEQLITAMVGRSEESVFPPRSRPVSDEVVLEVRSLVAPPAVEDASFELRRGEVLGIAGLIGSGRTEMVRAIFELIPRASGTIAVHGDSSPQAGKTSTLERIKQGFGYLSEDRKGEGLALKLPIADNVTLTFYSSCSRWGWLNRSSQASESQKWISALQVKTSGPWAAVQTLSGGNQQKVALARLLHQKADIFLLDEPTRGIDIGSKAQIYETIRRLTAEGKSVLMVSSYLPELFGICDRLAVMSQGRLSAARPIAEWTPETVMEVSVATAEPLATGSVQ